MSDPTDCPRCGCGLEPYATDERGQDHGPYGCPDCHWFEGEPTTFEESEREKSLADELADDGAVDAEAPDILTESEQVGDPGFAFGGPR
jgi:hypothetical protein